MTERAKQTLNYLINKELEEEHTYQFDNVWMFGEFDDSLLRDLIYLEKELYYNRAKGFDKFIQGELIKDDIDKYINSLYEELEDKKRLEKGE